MRPRRRASDPPTPDLTRWRLTPREREVTHLVADGLDDAAIAGRLGLAPSTVGLTVRQIRLRLRLKRRADIESWVAARRRRDDPGGGLRRADDDPLA